MLYSLHHKKKIIGLFDNLESCNKMVTGLESNKFINYKDIKIRTYVENSIILISDDKFNNYKNEKNNDTDYESDSVYSDSLRSTKSSRYSDDDHENDDNNKEEDNKKEDNKKEDNKEEDNKEEDNNILKLDKDQIEKMSKSEEYLKIYKDKQEVKLKKEKIEIEKRKILNKKKPTIVCGDLNVAHKEIDIHNPKGNVKNSGFTIEERNSFDKLLEEAKLIDTFRYKNNDLTKYSFWTYMFNARSKNKGWRIDYFLISKKIINWVKKSEILTEVKGSDHAPVLLKLTIN